MTYAQQVEALEAEGLTTSDAQAVADAEAIKLASYETQMVKGREGWEAKTTIMLEDVPVSGSYEAGSRLLHFSTYKDGRGGIVTRASVCVRSKSFGGWSEQTALFEDYMATVAKVPSARVTEKAIAQAHEAAKALFSNHLAAAKKQYNIAAGV